MARTIVSLFAALLLFPALSTASADKEIDDQTILNRFSRRVVQTWNSPTVDLFVPVLIWHNRLTYDSERAKKYNEAPWGIGLGKSMTDEDGDWHSLYYIGFQDSHNMYQPMIGYAFQKNWHFGEKQDWRLGLGYTLGITARQQYNYIPFPLPLPIFGIEYNRLALQGTYIPGGRNDGNVLFCWLRWQLN